MPTSYSTRTIPTTTYGSRDPVGRSYLATEDGKIITTEDGKWIIVIDSQDTVYSARTQITTTGGIFKINSSDFLKINTTDMLKTQSDYPYTLYTGRTII